MKHISRALLIGAALAASCAAMAQYQWTDSQGRRVFSDSPPPPDARNVQEQAFKTSAPAPQIPAANASAASAAAGAASAPSPAPGVDKALEEKKKQAEAAEAAKKKAEEQKIAAQRAENCRRALNNKATLEAGVPIKRMNAKGEVEYLNDTQRAAETKRTQDAVRENCN
ncbi:MAG: DUF4124 domain-containing protein [Burkholderiaceae bacterium]|jgi:hypothetical protein|nr:DUF4124 domain-containing protein [Burkholderiaceae bacterium]